MDLEISKFKLFRSHLSPSTTDDTVNTSSPSQISADIAINEICVKLVQYEYYSYLFHFISCLFPNGNNEEIIQNQQENDCNKASTSSITYEVSFSITKNISLQLSSNKTANQNNIYTIQMNKPSIFLMRQSHMEISFNLNSIQMHTKYHTILNIQLQNDNSFFKFHQTTSSEKNTSKCDVNVRKIYVDLDSVDIQTLFLAMKMLGSLQTGQEVKEDKIDEMEELMLNVSLNGIEFYLPISNQLSEKIDDYNIDPLKPEDKLKVACDIIKYSTDTIINRDYSRSREIAPDNLNYNIGVEGISCDYINSDKS